MLSPKYLPKHKPSIDDQLKLPQIPSRKNIQSLKKNSPPLLDLPQIKNKPPKQNLSVNKENNSLNLLQRKNSLENQIKARLFEVQAAEKVVKNVLGGPQATVHLGGDMTNFELKIQINREILRKQRNKSHFTQQNPNVPQTEKNAQSPKEPILKCVSSNEIPSESIQIVPAQADMKLKINQNCEFDGLAKKGDNSSETEPQNRKQFNSKRKPKKFSKSKNEQNAKVFKSIKQILENPQRVALKQQAKKVKRMVKFTIEQLENRLRQMKNVDLSQSAVQGSEDTETSKKFQRKMTSAKSAGMIPIFDAPFSEQYTFKNWNKIEFGQPEQESEQGQIKSNKLVRYHKSDFDHQVDHIKKLEMKSYKSIEKMVENRKLLIDLQLMNVRNKSCVTGEKKVEQKQTQLSI